MFIKNLSVGPDGHLMIGGCDTVALAEKYGTPLYVIDEGRVRENCRLYRSAVDSYYDGNGLVLYASKALSCKEMCRIAMQEGLGLDVVSGGELYTALSVNFPTDKICFHGNNKTPDELKMAVENNVGRIVVDNRYELQLLNEIAGQAGKTAAIQFRIKPGVDAHTHEFIRTGQIDSKFGVALENGEAAELIEYALSLPNVNLTGLHCHIGSQIFDFAPFLEAATVMMGFIAELREKYGCEIKELNLGGGYGIRYTPDNHPVEYNEYLKNIALAIRDIAAQKGIPLPFILMEPGRSIVGEAGITLYRIGGVKDIKNVRKYISVDGGMTDNPRYIMYQAEYDALIANRANAPREEKVTIAGKCCESGDLLAKDILMPKCEAGDILAVLSTGAYNYSMASNYNRIPRPPIVMVKEGRDRLVVKRESYDDLINNDL